MSPPRWSRPACGGRQGGPAACRRQMASAARPHARRRRVQDAATASKSAAQEAHGQSCQIDHAAGLARQGGGSGIDHAAGLARQTAAHRLQLVANCSTSAAVGGKSARKIVLTALQSPINDVEFVELSRGLPVVAKRTISGMKCIHSCCTSYTRNIDQIL